MMMFLMMVPMFLLVLMNMFLLMSVVMVGFWAPSKQTPSRASPSAIDIGTHALWQRQLTAFLYRSVAAFVFDVARIAVLICCSHSLRVPVAL